MGRWKWFYSIRTRKKGGQFPPPPLLLKHPSNDPSSPKGCFAVAQKSLLRGKKMKTNNNRERNFLTFFILSTAKLTFLPQRAIWKTRQFGFSKGGKNFHRPQEIMSKRNLFWVFFFSSQPLKSDGRRHLCEKLAKRSRFCVWIRAMTAQRGRSRALWSERSQVSWLTEKGSATKVVCNKIASLYLLLLHFTFPLFSTTHSGLQLTISSWPHLMHQKKNKCVIRLYCTEILSSRVIQHFWLKGSAATFSSVQSKNFHSRCRQHYGPINGCAKFRRFNCYILSWDPDLSAAPSGYGFQSCLKAQWGQ